MGYEIQPVKYMYNMMQLRMSDSDTIYRNDPKFSDKQVWANSADPDET